MVASPACPWDASLQLHGTILFLDRWGNRFGLKNFTSSLLQTRVSFAFKANLIEDSLLKVCLPISFMGAHVSRGEPRQKWHWALSGHFLLLLPQFLWIFHNQIKGAVFIKDIYLCNTIICHSKIRVVRLLSKFRRMLGYPVGDVDIKEGGLAPCSGCSRNPCPLVVLASPSTSS